MDNLLKARIELFDTMANADFVMTADQLFAENTTDFRRGFLFAAILLNSQAAERLEFLQKLKQDYFG